jgi:hypothetical protein
MSDPYFNEGGKYRTKKNNHKKDAKKHFIEVLMSRGYSEQKAKELFTKEEGKPRKLKSLNKKYKGGELPDFVDADEGGRYSESDSDSGFQPFKGGKAKKAKGKAKKGKRKLSAWNKFIRDHAGSGKSFKKLAELYHKQK